MFCMSRPASILCIHQGSELYGSDRSFFSAIEALRHSDGDIDVILPREGELAEEFRKLNGVNVLLYSKGVLRKQEMKRPLFFLLGQIAGLFFYLRRFNKYPLIYINTVVMSSALLAATFYRFSTRRIICHVREIPVGWQLKAFRALLMISGVELVFNSMATRAAFSLSGDVIYNGVSESCLPDASLGTLTKTPGVTNLLLIGRINEWKGQFFLIDALAGLPVEIRDQLRVRIVGSPFEGYEYLLDKLRRKIEGAGLSDVVSLAPFCADPSVHYVWTDYVLAASTQPEPFGRVAIEAFSYGKPVIAARHGGLVEIVEDGVSGFLFEPCNESALGARITQVLSVPAERYDDLSRAALQRFRHSFSIEGYQENLRTLLRV